MGAFSLRGAAQPVSAGVLASFVGFASSFAVVLKGLTAVGATDAQAASGLTALAVAMGLAGVIMSFVWRMPISSAWSTPGAALLAATGASAGGFPDAVGAFLIVACLIVLAGLVRPVGRLVELIPAPLANAMLAGVLFGLCLAPIRALIDSPRGAIPIVLTWLIVSRWSRVYATPIAAVVAVIVIALGAPSQPHFAAVGPEIGLIRPSFSPGAIFSIAVPLFIVTMASQNVPGLAVLSAYGYRPKPGPLLVITGVFTFLAAPFGGHSVNLSAITAALCAAPDASPDPRKRWIAAASGGAVYLVFGLFAGVVTAFVANAPILVEAVAGLALLGPFGSAMQNALADTQEREPALITFLVSASGVTIFGVGGAFWGLIVGALVLAFVRAGRSVQAP